MPAPFPLPIGLRLSQAARAVERAFDEALGKAGGTLAANADAGEAAAPWVGLADRHPE